MSAKSGSTEGRDFKPNIKIQFVYEKPFFGPGPVRLLREIDKCGNVREACESCGFSYSKGWTILRQCEREFGFTIVERQAGGQSGGAAKVTDKGHELIAVYEQMQEEISEIADRRFTELMEEHGLKTERE